MDVTVLSLINNPTWGLKAGDVGVVDSEMAAGLIAQGYLVITVDPTAKPPKGTPAETPAEI